MTQAPWAAQRVDQVVRLAADWLADPAIRELVRRLGGPATASPAALKEWSSQTLDTRQGLERRDAPPVAWPVETIEAILDAATELGLICTASPSLRAYDVTVILGGTTTGNQLRVQCVSEVLRDRVDLGLIALLSAERCLGAREHESDPDSVGESEWQNLLRHADLTFGPLQADPSRTGEEQGDHCLVGPAGRRLRVLIAPPPHGRPRPSTLDAARFLTERVPAWQRASMLLVTSAIYAPYQFFAVAPLLLNAGSRRVELIGTRTATRGRDRQRLAQLLAQEIHGGILSAVELVG